MSRLEYQYLNLLQNITNDGYDIAPAARQDVGTRQINSFNIHHDLREGFPLLTTKRLPFKSIVTELLWFLRGDTNIKYLVDNGCNVWNSDAYKFYLRQIGKDKDGNYDLEPMDESMFIERIKDNKNYEKSRVESSNYKLGDLGPIYGKQWRNRTRYEESHTQNSAVGTEVIATAHKVDQIASLIQDIKHAVDTGYNNRRLIVDAWNPTEVGEMALPPCHYGFQVILEPMHHSDRLMISDGYVLGGTATHEDLDKLGTPKYFINLKWNQRSVDTFLGLPFNIASYALLTHILGKITNTIPKDLIGNLTCVHIYDNHKEQVKEQLSREPRKLPVLDFSDDIVWENYGDSWDFSVMEPWEFAIGGYDPHPAIKAEIVT